MARSRSSAVLMLASVSLALGACHHHEEPAWSGYVEGDYVYVAAPIGGTLQTLAVRRGQAVSRGALLFALESESERAAREEAAARLASAQAQAHNIETGKRPQELAVNEAQLAQARTEAEFAGTEYERQRQLLAQGFISPAKLDDARTAMQQARQRVAELSAALNVAHLPAREDERTAAQASAQAAQQALRQSDWRAEQKQQKAPADAQVADTYFRIGEWVQPGQPVVALLPPGATRARFFVPESELGGIVIGQPVSLQCDGCGAPIAARIDFISTQAEYTPPVIYSNSQRARLVFMVEARPDAKDGARLKPGQPVDVRRVGQ
jgi:HlyD family secretion protein